MRFSLASILAISQLSSGVLGAFHLMLRQEKSGTWDCKDGPDASTCYCKYLVYRRIGAVPSQKYNCGNFKLDQWFQRTIGEGFDWNGAVYPSICGSAQVDLWVTNGGSNLEVWVKGANPGRKLATCYKQSGNPIDCGNIGDAICGAGTSKITDVWVCGESQTTLCEGY